MLAERGHDVVLTARSEDRPVPSPPSWRFWVPRPTSSRSTCLEGAVDRLVAWLGDQGLEIDVLANNAGFGTHGPTLEADPARERAMLQLLVQVPVDLSRARPRDAGARGGRLLQVASPPPSSPVPQLRALRSL